MRRSPTHALSADQLVTHELARLSRRIDSYADNCWTWGGYHNEDGYGRTKVRVVPDSTRGSWRAFMIYKYLYESLIAKVPPGLELDHLCRHAWCVNPFHLEPVTHEENMRRGFGFGSVNRAKTHCLRGHPFAPGTFYRMKCGGRKCHKCRRWRHANGGVA